jgi:hypothetical protein
VISEDPDKAELLDKGLKAFEWGFDHAGEDGSFPNERGGATKKQNSLHPKSAFIEAAARSALLLQQVDLEPSFRDRLTALLPRLNKSARWMAGSRDLEKFFKRSRSANQLLFIAAALQEAGAATKDTTLTERARSLVEQILSQQGQDGTFPEKGGFDSNYHTVSLELLGRYASTLPPSPWRDTVMAALRKGIDRFTQIVDETGTIDASANTRTVPCGPKVSGAGPKGRDIDIVPLRLHYLGQLLGEQERLGALADRIHETGQSFTHDDKCVDGQVRTKNKRAKQEP